MQLYQNEETFSEFYLFIYLFISHFLNLYEI